MDVFGSYDEIAAILMCWSEDNIQQQILGAVPHSALLWTGSIWILISNEGNFGNTLVCLGDRPDCKV